jgi:hypothetical protein
LQGLGAGATQLLLVLHVEAPVRLDPVQEAPEHWVPDAYFWQAPLPLQKPLVPQVAAPVSVHWVVGLGLLPPAIDVQVPTMPVRLHAVQMPVQAVLQQTLLTQNPETQAAPVVQAVPCESLPQLPVVVLQVAGVAQSAFAAQLLLHALLVPQAKGSQRVEVTALQLPAPSQVCAGVNVWLVQVAGAQVVVLL